MLIHVAIVLSPSLNHIEDNAGDIAETNTPPIPFSNAQMYAALAKMISSVENVLKLDPNSISHETTINYSLVIVNSDAKFQFT